MVDLVSGNIRHVAFDPNRLTEQADRGNSSKRQNPVLDWSQDRVVKKVKGKETSSMASKCVCLNYIISLTNLSCSGSSIIQNCQIKY